MMILQWLVSGNYYYNRTTFPRGGADFRIRVARILFYQFLSLFRTCTLLGRHL